MWVTSRSICPLSSPLSDFPWYPELLSGLRYASLRTVWDALILASSIVISIAQREFFVKEFFNEFCQ